MAKSLASHISSKGKSQSGEIKIGASTPLHINGDAMLVAYDGDGGCSHGDAATAVGDEGGGGDDWICGGCGVAVA
ncbi:hypothetical protein Tco_1031045 [Tanacetum coccineum]|uniref:Uncharacterized protein n=1 Tax=Tanacetum coccineum TaxID=301880 RepID=A0ABQ5G8P8_9ASTR